MKKFHRLQILETIALIGFAVFTFGFSHLNFSQPYMGSMEAMSEHTGSTIKCQILCSTMVKTDEQGILLTNLENEAKDLLSIATVPSTVILSLLAVAFVVKQLHLVSSWRPPDRTLLYGHFADGL